MEDAVDVDVAWDDESRALALIDKGFNTGGTLLFMFPFIA
jgi:hypothetical protein